MAKKILGVLLTIGLVILFLIPAGAEQEMTPEEAEELMLQQMKALDAHQTLFDTFPVEGGFHIFPDDYAGSWIEAHHFHVALTSDAPDVVDRYKEILKDFEDITIFETEGYPYSYNYLLNITQRAFGLLSDEGFPITSGAPDAKGNIIRLEFFEADKSAVSEFLSGHFPIEIFKIEAGEYAVLQSAEEVAHPPEIIEPRRPAPWLFTGTAVIFIIGIVIAIIRKQKQRNKKK